ncbi:MAG TPA: glutathione S-transferase family protein [Parvularculaceae bacterium]|nr:glutathione S-transferase family protein [Parvularculaceae bacterium]
MYRLYYAPGSASFAIHWMLIELGVPFELVKIDLEAKEHKKPEYLKLNPAGVVPTLIVDGKPQAETAALLLLLAERHAEAKLFYPPGDALRGEFLETMFYFANTLQPAYRLWYYPEEGAGSGNVEATMALARGRLEAAWDRLDRRFADGRRFFVGDLMTVADFMGVMLARWSRNMPRPAQSWANVGAYLARMKEMPSLREVYGREGLTHWIND